MFRAREESPLATPLRPTHADQSAYPADARSSWDRRKWYILAAICVAQFMVVLDIAIVNVALPSIRTDLDFTNQSLQWVLTAYAILFGGFLLLGGRLADRFGRRLIFMTGLAVFTGASLMCGLAWSEGSLIAFRAVAGLRRRSALAGRAVDPRHHVHRGSRAQPRPGHLGRDRGQRRGGGDAARRRPDQRVRLGVDLLRQRADRRRSGRPDAVPALQGARGRPRTSQLRRGGRRHRDGRPHGAGVRAHTCHPDRLVGDARRSRCS